MIEGAKAPLFLIKINYMKLPFSKVKYSFTLELPSSRGNMMFAKRHKITMSPRFQNILDTHKKEILHHATIWAYGIHPELAHILESYDWEIKKNKHQEKYLVSEGETEILCVLLLVIE